MVPTPFWDAYVGELSERVWKPDSGGLISVATKDWGTPLLTLASNSWFNVKVQRCYNLLPLPASPSTHYDKQRAVFDQTSRDKWNEEVLKKADKKRKRLKKAAETMANKKKTLSQPSSTPDDEEEYEPEIKPPPEKSFRIRLFPTSEQANTLRKWIGAARWCYNTALAGVKNEGVKIERQALRNYALNNPAFQSYDLFDWLLETPYDVRDAAVNELYEAYISNFAKKKLNPDHRFSINFRKKKGAKQETIIIHSKHLRLLPLPDIKSAHRHGHLVLYPRIFGKEPIKSAEPIPDDALRYDCKLSRDRLGHFYLHIPRPLVIQPLPPSLPSVVRNPSSQDSSRQPRVASLDPGVRTFQTIFDVNGGVALEWGKNDMGRIARLLHHLDDLQSRRDHKDIRARQRYKINKAMERIRQKVRNLVNDAHHRLAKFLCESYDHILLPHFETSKMSRKTNRKIRSETVRSMLTWSHYRFKILLKTKAREYPWVRIHDVDEAYTSKTCTGCGLIKNNIGGAKVYNCSGCGGQWDRDIAGARNIYLKNERVLGSFLDACCGLAPSSY